MICDSNEKWKEYELGELLSYEQPTPYIVESTDYNEKYDIPVLTAGKSFVLGYTNEQKGVYTALPVIIFDDFTTASRYVNFKFKVKSSAMKILTPNTELVLPKFIYYRMQIIQFDHSTHKRYWIQQYSKIKVAIPPIPVQQRIVDCIEELFSELDHGIETLQKTKQQLAVYRQAVLKKAFEGAFTKEWRAVHCDATVEKIWVDIVEKKKQCKSSKPYKLEESITLSTLPMSWKWVNIGDISKGPEYGTSQKSVEKGRVPVVRMGNIQKGVIDWGDLVFSSDETEIEKYRLMIGDVLFNRTNSPELVGKTAIYRGEREAIFAGYLIRINQFDCINADYLAYYMNSFTAKQYGNRVKTDGVNQSNINGKKLCSYPFPLCSQEEQAQVVYELESRLSVCDSIEKTVDTALQQAEAMRQSILKQAFEGKL